MTASRPAAALVALSVCALALAATTLLRARHVPVWHLSIVATEYGHWLALACLALMAALVAKVVIPAEAGIQVGPDLRHVGATALSGGMFWFAIVCLMAAAALFARPAVLAALNDARWEAALSRVFGIERGPLFRFGALWRVRPVEAVLPERLAAPSPSAGRALPFDFYRARSSGPAPWVVAVHGGGWDNGDPSVLPEMNSALALRGIAVAAVSYRLVPEAGWPAQREDVLAAVAHLKANAVALGLDPQRWAILGRSAGGQIAEAVAYQKADPTLRGVVALYSPADLEFAYRHAADKDIINSKGLVVRFVGGTPESAPEAYRDASPIRFAGRRSPPTLLMHGANDPLTWVVQSRRLYEHIVSDGGRAAYIELPWATHAFDFNPTGPGGQVASAAVVRFLGAVFK